MRLTDNQEVVDLCGLALICADRTPLDTPISVLECAESPSQHRTRATRTCAAAHGYAELRRKTKGRLCAGAAHKSFDRLRDCPLRVPIPLYRPPGARLPAAQAFGSGIHAAAAVFFRDVARRATARGGRPGLFRKRLESGGRTPAAPVRREVSPDLTHDLSNECLIGASGSPTTIAASRGSPLGELT